MSVIETHGLTKIYNNNVFAVNGIDLEIFEGEVFGFLGPNGAGKSTTINMIAGILKPTSGTIKVMGHSIPKKRREVLDLVGYVPQDLVFYDHLTVDENLQLFAKAYGVINWKSKAETVKELLELGELSRRISRDMSGGQKRRLSLALALMHDPKLLFLDEPSAGMDPQSRNILWESVQQMAKEDDMTIILSTHLMETADRLSDRICIIDHGVIKVVDTPEGLKSKFGAGDVIKVQFVDELTDEDLLAVTAAIAELFGKDNVKQYNHTLSFSHVDGVNAIASALPVINTTIGRDNVKQLSMSDNSLEDVFIHITGHKLRE